MSTDATRKNKVPLIIGFRPGDLAPLISKWQEKNPRIGYSEMIRRALRQSPEFKELAGVRHAHLVA